MNEYEKQAQKFLEQTNTEFKAAFLKHGLHFEDDKPRDIYLITLKRGNRIFKFNLGQSLDNSLNPEYRQQIKNRKVGLLQYYPSAYDVLTCLTKYDPEDFKNFCSEYGYNEDSRKAERIYKAVVDEYKNVCMLWNEAELKILREIN
jgi:hypothetical protein